MHAPDKQFNQMLYLFDGLLNITRRESERENNEQNEYFLHEQK